MGLVTVAHGWAQEQTPENPTGPSVANSKAIILPQPIRDPIEPVNRAFWAFNQGILKGAIQPSSKVYRAVVPSELRRGIRNAGQNLEYPRNLANNLLQQKWTGARDETYRFLLNSVAGIGGLFDVATDSGIRPAANDFGQTLREWGWDPRIYLMLPITGPSNERDALGGFGDRMVNPLTYFSPYSYIPAGITYNNLTDTVDEYVRVAKAEFDPYYVLRYAWTVSREAPKVDLSLDEAPATEALDTLQSVFFRLNDRRFPENGKKRYVDIAATGKKLPYTLWLQPRNAPIVYLIPGIGSHRLSGGALAMAELLFNHGFSVVSVSSTYNYEFMESAATTLLPGYAPVDARDLHVALTEIHKSILSRHPEQITGTALLGYSMGGFQTLYLAGLEAKESGLLIFDRYVAINSPVQLGVAITELDNHFNAALEWPAENRTENIEYTLAKVAALAGRLYTLTPDSRIPLSTTESRFLVGLAFRITLRDIIFLSQSRTNLGILKRPLNKWNREESYSEIYQYSFRDYLDRFVTPYYLERGIDLNHSTTLEWALDLRKLERGLKGNPKVRIVTNANDFVLGKESLNWLQTTFENGQLTLFERGGHLGNLNQTVVQREIVRTLSDLLPSPSY